MDILTQTIKTEIKNQYKTVRAFAEEAEIPQTTLSSIFKNGVGGTGYATVIKICRLLDIQLVNFELPMHIDSDALKIMEIYNRLDERGRHSVRAMLKIENDRCMRGMPNHSI